MLNWVFPSLKRIYLFEPLPHLQPELYRIAARDKRIKVLPYALANIDGEFEFQVTSNDGESSSLLPLGRHEMLFPDVKVTNTIKVQSRRLAGLITSGEITVPDLLMLDVQGAEHQILESIPEELVSQIRLIYSEVSMEPVYLGSRPLKDIEELLGNRFVNIGYAPIMTNVPIHGNAVFVRRGDLSAALAYTMKGYARKILQQFGLR